MRIEEVIKQHKFTDSYHKAVVNLIFSGNWARDEQSDMLKSFDILPQHFNILRIIKGHHPKPVSPGEIGEVMIDKASDITRLLDKLEKKEWIKRRICPSNRRKMDVTITEKGIIELNMMGKKLDAFLAKVKERLTEDEAERLSNLLDKIRS